MSKKSALNKSEGTPSSRGINRESAQKIRASRKKSYSVQVLFEKIREGDHTALSKGITLIESSNPVHIEQGQQLTELCLPFSGNSIRIGITGVPGVGKSTFIETFGNHLTGHGKKLAVLAVDPSSTVSGGSIMGDKTRMETLVNNPAAFIRPSPSGDSLGGVAKKTRESIILCEAAGFDTILIETVGVGQSGTTVHSMSDFFLLLKLAGAGDELQGIKRGIMEMADAIVINKADGENIKPAKRAMTEFSRALHLYPPKDNGWSPEVILCSALEKTGIPQILEMIAKFEKQVRDSGHFNTKRHGQNKFWLLQTIEEHLKNNFFNDPVIKPELKSELDRIDQNKTTAFAAAKYLLGLKSGK